MGNKATRRISKRMFQENKSRQIFRKTNISYPLIVQQIKWLVPTWNSTLGKNGLTLSRRRSLSYRNQSINLLRKSMDWFLYDKGLRHERVNIMLFFLNKCTFCNKYEPFIVGRLTTHRTLILRFFLIYMLAFTIFSDFFHLNIQVKIIHQNDCS